MKCVSDHKRTEVWSCGQWNLQLAAHVLVLHPSSVADLLQRCKVLVALLLTNNVFVHQPNSDFVTQQLCLFIFINQDGCWPELPLSETCCRLWKLCELFCWVFSVPWLWWDPQIAGTGGSNYWTPDQASCDRQYCCSCAQVWDLFFFIPQNPMRSI